MCYWRRSIWCQPIICTFGDGSDGNPRSVPPKHLRPVPLNYQVFYTTVGLAYYDLERLLSNSKHPKNFSSKGLDIFGIEFDIIKMPTV